VKEGHEGLVRAKAARPELILLDMMCANLEGTAILDRLKKAPVTKSMRWLSSQARLKKNRGRRVSGKVSLVLDGDGRSLLTVLWIVWGDNDAEMLSPVEAECRSSRANSLCSPSRRSCVNPSL
jgi:hypothetical protein